MCKNYCKYNSVCCISSFPETKLIFVHDWFIDYGHEGNYGKTSLVKQWRTPSLLCVFPCRPQGGTLLHQPAFPVGGRHLLDVLGHVCMNWSIFILFSSDFFFIIIYIYTCQYVSDEIELFVWIYTAGSYIQEKDFKKIISPLKIVNNHVLLAIAQFKT